MATTIQSGYGSSPKLTADVASRAEVYGGRGLIFDAVSDYLNVSNISFTGEFTISCWFKADDLSSGRPIVGDTGNSHWFKIADTDTVALNVNGSNTEWDSGAVFSTGVWTFISVVRDSDNKIIIYKDGIGYTSNQPTKSGTFTTNAIGQKGNSQYFDGTISDVKFYSSALSESDILSQYLKPESVPSPSTLVAWYPMSEGNPDSPQSIVYDHSKKKLSAEKAQDNTFSNTTASQYWNPDVSGNFSISNNKLHLIGSNHGGSTGSFNQFIDQNPNNNAQISSALLTSGSLYKVTGTVTVTSKNGGEYLRSSFDASYTRFSDLNVGTESFTKYLVANETFVNIQMPNGGADTNISIDAFSVKEVLMGNHATTNFFGDELLTNDSTNWENSGAFSSVAYYSSGTNSGAGIIKQDGFTLSAGKTYQYSFAIGAGHPLRMTLKSYDGSVTYKAQADYASNTTHPVTITPSSDKIGLMFSVSESVSGDSNLTLSSHTLKEIGISSTGFATAQNEPTIPQIPLVKYNEKMLFSDANYVNCGTLLGDNLSGGLTISLWFNATAIATNNGLFSFNSGLEIASIFEGGKIAFYLNGVKWSESSTITLEKTYHVVFSLDTSSHANSGIYINGVKDSTGTATNFPASDVLDLAVLPFIIGRYYSDAFSHDGLIDDVSMFNTVFDSTQVQELFNDGIALDATTSSKKDNLLGYWRNDGITTWTDRSDIQAIGFDGTDDRITTGSNIGISGTNAFTMMCWFNLNVLGNHQTLMASGGSGANTRNTFLVYNTNKLAWNNGIGANDFQVSSGTTFTTGTWYYGAVTYDGNTTIKLYVNGVLKGTKTTVNDSEAINFTNSALVIGRRNPSQNDLYFNGQISQCAVYNSALEPSDILGIYNLGRRNTDLSVSYSTNLIGYWLLNPTHSNPDLTGSNKILDRSTNSNHGTESGGVNFLGTNDGTVNPTDGSVKSITIREGLNSNKDGLGFSLKNLTSNVVRFSRNGLAEYLSIPITKGLDIQGNFTVEFWMKQPDMGSGYQQIINRDDTSNRNWSVQSVNGTIRLGYYSGGSFGSTSTSGTYDDDKWHHVCAIFTSGTSVQIYVDTVLVKLNTSSIPTTIDNDPAVLNIGKRTGTTQFFIGSLDEVRFYNKALTAFESDGSAPEEGETAVSGEVVKNYKHGKGKHKND